MGLFLIYIGNLHPQVQVIKNGEASSAQQFLMDVANMNNKKGLEVEIAGTSANWEDSAPYVSDKGQIMFPLAALQDLFNCSVQEYADGGVLIEKGENTIKLAVGSGVASVNEKRLVMKDVVVEENGKTYVPIAEFSDALNYTCDVSLSKAMVVMHQISEEIVLPSKYDMRDVGRVTPVRNQGLYGTCWAFASLGALESTLAPTEKLSFSPDHMSLCNHFNLNQNAGGEYTMAIAYLAGWQGPVYESDDPYGDGETNENLQARKHLQEARILQSKDYEGIKEAVYKYGAVQTSIYTQLKNADSWSSYYNRERATYYYNQETTCNHDTIIVGWNDDFPKEYFTIEPEEDGAFICKNSWGDSFGEEGYFYVSYYDCNIGTSNVVYTNVEAADNYDKIYQSDLLGWVGQLGYSREDAYFANVYEADQDEELEAVSFYATGPNTQYEVYYVEDFTDETDLNEREQIAKGSFQDEGYYTVKLETPKKLEDNKKFAIVVYINTPDSIHPVAIEYKADSRTSNFDIEDGQGYISLYGSKWVSAEETQNCNLCLKAFTNKRSD